MGSMGESDGEDAQIDANMRSNMLKLFHVLQIVLVVGKGADPVGTGF